ncbi:ARID DNA-binding domain [Sergentomyia squamirostris]
MDDNSYISDKLFYAFGPPCAYHGPYTFFNQVQIISFAPASTVGGPLSTHIDDLKASTYNNNITTRRKNNLRRSESVVMSEDNRRTSILRLGDCVPVCPWSDQRGIACLAEIRMVWRDKGEQSLLIGLRLYFLPENTPLGRHGHGEDEVVAISDAVVIKADDLLSWLDVDLEWSWGFRVQSGKSSNHSKFTPHVSVVSFSKYCRFRALMKRIEHIESDWLRNALIDALGGSAIDSTCSRIMFCKETFDYPELETHELLCNHLAPKLKGRPRGRRKKRTSDTYHHHQGAKYEATSDSESAAESESSSCSSKMNFAKAKIEVQQQHLRYSQRNQRVRLKTEPSAETTENDSEMNEEKMKAKKENERKFLTDLHRFMVERKTPIPKMMWLSLRRVNLYDIFTRVQEFGGYETVSVNRLWKTLKKDSPGLTHSKYEKVLLPYELHQRSLLEAEEAACKREKADLGEMETVSNGQMTKAIKVEKVEPELSREQMTEIQNKVKAKEQKQQKQQGKEHQKMQVSVPVTVIVGSTSGSEEKTTTSQQIQIQQPRTTITVHQTTIHPQVTGSGHTTKSSSQQITNQIQITNEIKIQQITLPKGGKVGSSDSSDNGDEHGGKASSLRHIRVKSNSRKFPENVPTIDLRCDSDDDTVQPRVSAMYPPIRKRKLDILREGGLEVTPIRSKDTVQPLKQPRLTPTPDTNVFRKVENIPKFQSKCMFTQAEKIFGNPKENVAHQRNMPSSSAHGEVLDLTAKKAQDGGRPVKNLTPGVAALIPSFPALANPNLMISFVPPVMQPSLADGKTVNFGNFLPHMLDPSRHHPAFVPPPPLNLPPLPPGLTIANLAELNAGMSASMNPYLLSYMYGANGFLPPSGNLPPPFFDNGSKNNK